MSEVVDEVEDTAVQESINRAKDLEKLLLNEAKMHPKNHHSGKHPLPRWAYFLYVLTLLVALFAFIIRIKNYL